ncbi:SulP family inorganic anion transporter [uncultured Maribacter sp.]|uniref:SulP family inorganic anion transporter n=1 Tax=uncultured Maribacter sp. TaxID=431308 RepID=UPI002623D815|nr:sulfate permease [uncultured Maribacter sp.]
MYKFFPFQQWLGTYKKAYLSKDIIAGLTVGIILIPQGMAYAMIAGLPPVYGLYASLLPILTYVFLGTSRQVAVGPVAMDSLLVAASLGTLAITSVENYIAMVIVLAFLVGATQILLGVFKMGFLVNYLSRPVISGFTSAAALIIIFSQIKHLLGIKVERATYFHELLVNVFSKISETNKYDFLIGALGIVIIILLKKINKKIPSILIVVVIGIIGVYFLNLESIGVNLVGKVPSGLPSFKMPNLSLDVLTDLWPMAIALAMVGYLEAISIGKAMEEKTGEETIDANKELIAIGSSNVMGSFFQAYPVTASFSRSAINSEAGAKTNLAALFSVIMVVVTLLYLTPVFYYLPKAVLASIIMVSVFGLIDLEYAKRLLNHRKDEFLVLVITFLITLFIGIKEGILVGVLISLLLMVYRTSNPHFAVLGKIKGTDYYRNVNRFEEDVVLQDNLLIIRFDAQLYFANASYFKKEIDKCINAKGVNLRGIILNAEAINYIDSTAANMLKKLIKELEGKNINFYIAGAIGPTRDILYASGIIEVLKRENLFAKTNEAVMHFNHPKIETGLGFKIAHQNKMNSD